MIGKAGMPAGHGDGASSASRTVTNCSVERLGLRATTSAAVALDQLKPLPYGMPTGAR